MEQIVYKIEQFEGPLDLLLTLVTKNKMNIEDIQISIIFDQYMEYMNTMQSMNIELSAEFIVMASELMYIKSKLLLPRINEEEDPRERLAAAILEYKRAKEASQKLGSLYAIYNGRMEKDTDEISADRSYVAEHDINLLSIAIMKIMNNVKVSDEEASEKIKPLISTRTVSVNERVFAILRILLINNGRVNVLRCFEGITTKHELVATFMAILEMLKAGRVMIKEDEIEYSETGVIELENNIYIELFEGKIRSLGDENDG